jgi:hypothetical protein
MPEPVFHLDSAGSISPLIRSTFVSEHELQALIARHPALLAGETAVEGRPFMIKRQGPAPSEAVRAARWSVDHLFLDRDAVPTVIETRWAADPEAAGDLFGDVLYYAANAGAWWPAESLKASFAATHGAPGADADSLLLGYIGEARSPDAFWAEVAANLAAGRIRVVLVVERKHPELARMMTFLGERLRDTQVRLLEVRQHVGPSGRLLQLKVVAPNRDTSEPAVLPAVSRGHESLLVSRPAATTAAPPQAVRRTSHVNAQRDAWVRGVRASCDDEEAAVFDELLRWMDEQYGATFVAELPTPAFRLAVKEAGKDRFPFGLTTTKMATIHLGALAASRAFEGEEARRALVGEVAAAGLVVESADIDGDLCIALKSLAEPRLRARLLTVLDGMIESLRLKEALNAFPMRR